PSPWISYVLLSLLFSAILVCLTVRMLRPAADAPSDRAPKEQREAACPAYRLDNILPKHTRFAGVCGREVNGPIRLVANLLPAASALVARCIPIQHTSSEQRGTPHCALR